MASLEAAVGVRRNERDDFRLRRRDDLDHDRDGGRGEPPERALFPRGDECANGIVVVNGATGAREREPPAHAVPAATHGPGGRRAAALAESGGSIRGSWLRQAEQSCVPRRPQTTHRCGSTRSSTDRRYAASA